MKRSKRYRELREGIDRTREYPPGEAVSTVKALQSAKFNEAVEVHIRLGVNVRHADQQVRGTMVLPNGLGRDVSVAVFAQGDKAREAEAAGADAVGGDDLAERVSGGWTDFDVAIATPDMMSVVGKLGRILGPQGKMPNPKVGTVTEDVGRAVEQAKAGRVEYRTDRTGIVHLVIGRAELRRAQAARELRRADRRDRAREARGGEGALHPLGHAHHDDGPGGPRRPHQDARPAGGAGGRIGGPGRSPALCATIAIRDQPFHAPKTAGSREAEARPRWMEVSPHAFPARLCAGFLLGKPSSGER